MSFLKSLFGRGSSSESKAPAPTQEHKGFVIRATPYQEGGQYQTAGVIEKEIEGVLKRHEFIRADRHTSLDGAVEFTFAKARQIIDEQAERIFD